MDILKQSLLYVMGGAYIFAGLMHFLKPAFFLRVMPPYIPFPKLVNWFVGLLEIALGLAVLFPQTRTMAAYGLVALLVLVFPANVYNYQIADTPKEKRRTLIRLPFQLLFILWALWYV